jgi:NAD(P)-dependent dehydrogenase (short-subunit alcohol dehydrogenase family)
MTVTGSTDGAGRMGATRLGAAGAHVLVHGREAERGARRCPHRLRDRGWRRHRNFFPADFAILAEVRRLATAVQQATDRLDILINNAGIGTAGGTRQTSADGFELRFAVNYSPVFC